ncbi:MULTISPECIES: hypothetical protein [unclassified Mesorhizobium]|uniref:hypothetical protein n=1 Tax=Mesorhizobium sp. LNHC229A00 TaxID=1287240 RepID=UPI0003CF3960|nr:MULTISPECIES: hypothetical protein [unclassified Mesorhizobium]ESY81904.1 hypothetical protein X741_34205 [Mesorhizobium sp. LNHC229A00]
MPEVMVEIKPADAATMRFAIRTAIGQLLDYRQHQRWIGRQVILVGAKVTSKNDLSLAFATALAWPGPLEPADSRSAGPTVLVDWQASAERPEAKAQGRDGSALLLSVPNPISHMGISQSSKRCSSR